MGVRWGLLSTAAINDQILAAARASEHAEIVAVASRDAGRAAAYAERHEIPRSHGSYDDLLADPGVEAVYIPLPNAMHVEWARRALEAGKHVLVEKPFGRDPARVAEVCALAEQRGLVLSEAFMWRHHPQAARLEGLLRDGAIGRPLLVRAAFGFPLEELRGATDTRFDAASSRSEGRIRPTCRSATAPPSGVPRPPLRTSTQQHLPSAASGAPAPRMRRRPGGARLGSNRQPERRSSR